MQKHNTLPRTVTIPALLSIGTAVAAALFLAVPLPTSFMTVPVALLYVLSLSYLLGKIYVPQAHTETQWLAGSILLCSYASIILSVLFYTYHITPTVIELVTAVSPVLLFLKPKSLNYAELTFDIPAKPLTLRDAMSRGSILLLCAILGAVIIRSRTLSSVVSPWPLIPPSVFMLYGALAFLMLLSFVSGHSISWKRIVPLFMVSLTVAAVIFPLGYGFDPFIHQATERILLTTGTIQPQPLYYIGYYVLIAWLATISHLHFQILDTYLSLALGIVLLPLAASAALRYLTREKKFALIAVTSLLLLPYPFLIQSTPQAASFIFALIGIFMGIQFLAGAVPSWMLLCTTVVAALLQPLTGAPLIIAALFIICWKNLSIRSSIRKAALGMLFAIGICIVPIMLSIAAARSSEFHLHIALHGTPMFLAPFLPAWYRYTNLDDLIYTFSQSAGFLWIVLAIGGMLASDRDTKKTLLPFALLSGMLILAYCCMSLFLSFNFSTSIEQQTFASRIASLSLLMATPLALVGLYQVLQGLARLGRSALILCLLILSLGLTMSWYASYPHFDTREQDTGYSASAADYQAVTWIHTDGGASPYIVLADQTVAAVAIQSFGFAHYYNTLLYYPLPTNGPLYQQYLQAMNPQTPLANTLADTSRLTGVKRIYIVLNAYWDSADTLRTLLGSTAQQHKTFTDSGKVDVFMYEVP